MIFAAHNALVLAAKQVAFFVFFIARHFAGFYAALGMAALVLLFEYAATSLMIPLAASSGSASGAVQGFWIRVAQALSLEAGPRTWLWLFLAAMAGRLAVGYLQSVTAILLGKRVHRMLSRKIFDHVVEREPLANLYARSIGHYITLAGDDTSRGGTIIISFLQWLVGLLTSLVALWVLFQFSPWIFTVVALFLLVCGALVGAILVYVIRATSRANGLSRDLNTAFIEAINNLRSIRALGAGRIISEGYARQISAYVMMLFRVDAMRMGARVLPAIVLLVAATVLLRPGSGFSADEVQLFAATVIIVRIFAALGQMVAAGSVMLTDIRGVGDIGDLTRYFDEPVAEAGPVSEERIKSLALEDVDFSYPSRGRVLHRISARFESGKVYAIVGPSGSGKSTLADLLLGLIQPDAGRVTINDAGTDAHQRHSKLLLVEQQPKIFSSSLRENLLFGIEAGDDALWAALELVDLGDMARQLESGLDTPLTYLGENLSGGQRQRIGIARALLRRPDVLILDEASSALDTRTRELVSHNLRQFLRDGILIFITHDQAVAALADQVLDLGQARQAAI